MNDYPQKFDTTNLTNAEKEILSQFHKRRELFNDYLKNNAIPIFTCPCCGYPTLRERGGYEICNICFWEDDNQDDESSDEIWGGPNGKLSLTEGRLEIGKVLFRLAKELEGRLDLNLSEVDLIMKKIDETDIKLMNFRREKIKADTNINDPIYYEYKKLREDTLKVLVIR